MSIKKTNRVVFDEEKFKEAIGEDIFRIRKGTGLNQTKFAILTFGYSAFDGDGGQQKVSKVETGKQAPTILELHALLKVMKIDFNSFIHRILSQI